MKQVFHSSNYDELQPRWKRITPQPRDSRARSSSEQRDYRYIVRPPLRCKKTTNNFVQELSNGETILDGIRQDGANYIAHRYAQAAIEEVPLATVQDEFRYNSVLSGVITEEANEPEPEALAVIIGSHIADVVDLADNTGQGDLLVTSIRDAITVNVPLTDVATATNWLKTQHILQSQRQYLAEHHIYGSSRLGIQKYLPDQAQYHFKSLGATFHLEKTLNNNHE